jgi:hypothetical protein
MTALSKFTFVGNGLWWNETDNVSVMLSEDYKRTFRAYRWHRPHYRHIVKNKNGNDMRFRSAEAAAKYVLDHPSAD